jgi:hypothetical protein
MRIIFQVEREFFFCFLGVVMVLVHFILFYTTNKMHSKAF